MIKIATILPIQFLAIPFLSSVEPAPSSPDGVDDTGVIVKAPQKLAPLAEPETLSPAPPPKKVSYSKAVT